MNYLIWDGKDSRNIKGLIICELPPISKPQMRVIETVVDGVDGSIIEELGYESYDKAVSIGITQNADIDEISQFFNGSGEVVFSNEPNKYYKASVIKQIDYERLVRFRVATVTFRVQPFKYEYNEEVCSLNLDEFRNMANIKAVRGYEFSSLLPKAESTGFAINTFTGNSFSYSVSGDGYLIGLTNNFNLKPNTTYTLSMTRNETGGSSFRNFIYEVSNGAYAVIGNYIGTGEVAITFTTGDTGVVALGLGVGNNSNGASGTISNIMIVKGEQSQPFTEYGRYDFTIVNKGNYKSRPIIKITGYETINFSLNGNKVFEYTFPEGEDEVIVDCRKQDAYLNVNLKNRNMMGKFPEFETGENAISLGGTVSSIEISSKSRWL